MRARVSPALPALPPASRAAGGETWGWENAPGLGCISGYPLPVSEKPWSNPKGLPKGSLERWDERSERRRG